MPNTKPCTLCRNHYGDNGPCDEGKPVLSPHRSYAPGTEPVVVISASASSTLPDRSSFDWTGETRPTGRWQDTTRTRA